MRSYTFTLTGRPISKKNSKRIFRNRTTGAPFLMPSSQYQTYKNDCLTQIMQLRSQGKLPKEAIIGGITVQTTFNVKGNMRVDGDNVHTSILDIIQDAGLVVNDNQVQIGMYNFRRGQKDWSTEIVIVDLEEEHVAITR